MSDLIDRQAAIDAVCMEWCGVKHQDCKHSFDVEKDDYYWCDGCETVLRTLPDLPSAEPEIIRCRDCKFWTHIKRTNRYWCKTNDGLYDLNPSPDDFCSRAERRTDE